MTAVAGAIAALLVLVPHDHAPTVSSTIENVISVAAGGTVTQAGLRASQTSTAATAPAPPPVTNVHESGTTSKLPVPSTDDWAGRSAYTAILASKATEAEARAIQRTASERGLDAGVLFSSRFRSLRPGYWVVFSGAYASVDSASTHVQHAHALGFADAYPRYVSP